MAQNIFPKLLRVRTFVFDMDGVLTDGNMLIMGNDAWYRTMNVKDGYALQLATKKGYRIFVVSGSNAPEVGDRLKKLGITDAYFNVKDKKKFLSDYFETNTIDPSTVLYMGDDVPDLEAMQWCGVAACPADAVSEVISIAKYISPLSGGKGCVRDVIEKVLRLHKNWNHQDKITST